MQSYNNPAPPPPQPPYGAPPPSPAKKGMSTGVKVLIVVLVLAVGGGVVLVIGGAGLIYYLRGRAQEVAGTDSAGPKGLAGSATSGGAEAQPPSPTAEQKAAIAGGQTAQWEQQEISWTVPQKWKKYTAESQSFMWRSPGSWDAASLIVNISPMDASFPGEISLKSYYDTYSKDKQKYTDVRWVSLGGNKGVLFREASPEGSDDPQRLQWIGFRDYKGQKQMVNIMLASQGKYFAQHEDTMYGVLYSTVMGK
ncbi:MAG TPA: hypothetical protein VN282_03055 [Pyrinomonadaceae bacterium]|nr:hypothetical protein [Pyrinomonadaceae bacterium]